MVYYFSMKQSNLRKQDIQIGKEPRPIRLFPETPEIVDDFENNISSDWWGVYRKGHPSSDFADFDSIEDAYTAYYTNEGEDIYCMQHDC